MTFAARYEKLFTDNGLNLSKEDGIPESDIIRAETRLGVRLPQALRDFYLKAGEHELCQAYHHLVDLAEMDFKEDHLLFLDENQSVAAWGIARKSLSEDNPIVWQGANTAPMTWESEGLTVADYLEMVLYWQAACGGLEFEGLAVDLDANLLTLVEKQWPKARAHRGMHFFVKKGQFLVFNEEGGGKLSLLAAGTTLENFKAIDKLLGVEWESSILDDLEE